MAQFVAATSPSGEASYLINPDKIIYIMQTLTGESVLHFGEDETLHWDETARVYREGRLTRRLFPSRPITCLNDWLTRASRIPRRHGEALV